MKIVIVGAGEVGQHLAKLLSAENQDIVLVDKNEECLAKMDANYNLMTVRGDPTSFSVLRQAQAGKCDLFIAVTPHENDNVVACSMAKNLGAGCTVGRIESYDYMEEANRKFVTKMGVDSLIYPEYVAAQEIMSSLEHSWARHWFELHGGKIVLVGVRIRDNAPIAGTPLKDFAFANRQFHISAIRRNSETIIPRGSDVIQPGDILYITTTPDHIDDLLEVTGKVKKKIRRVIIMGGGKIAIRLANLSQGRFRIKIIDNDLGVCRRLPEVCPDCEIIHGDARDIDLLREVGIEETDAFVALSPSSETNILTCLTAKGLGVDKTVAEVENMQFITQAESLYIGTIVNKKLLASSSIVQLMIDKDSSNAKCLALSDAEVAEMEVKPGAKITKAPVKDLSLSRDVTLGGLIREGKGYLISGNTVIEPGDRVLVFCLNGAIHRVEKLFS